jgi:hypothetical protein
MIFYVISVNLLGTRSFDSIILEYFLKSIYDWYFFDRTDQMTGDYSVFWNI